MAAQSRNYVLMRRGGGINNLSNLTLTGGDLDLDQAEIAGVYRANCAHAVGIATSTEIGLTADRFPIRVILAPNAAAVPATSDETVCSYWRVTNSANLAIVFQRKPVASDLPIRNLYKMVPDLDNKLWEAYEAISSTAYTCDLEETVTARTEALYNILILTAPTAEQMAAASVLVTEIIFTCITVHRAPYFKVGENVYIRGEPHGRAYTQIGNMSAHRAALIESVICMKLNADRMKARYDTLQDGIITQSSYAVAAMFRHGLFESYEHREYYTVIVTPVATNPAHYTIVSIRTPRGIAPPTNIVLNQVIDVSAVKLMKQAVEIGNLMVFTSGLMHYLFNHTTGGIHCTGTLLTIMVMYQHITHAMPMETQQMITSLLYETLHPVNKRGIANVVLKHTGVTTHGRCVTAPRYDKFELDAFFQIRLNPYPAGSHKAFICMQALKRVLQAGLGPFLPWADQMSACIATCRDVLNNGARAHIGSSYYTGEPPLAQPSSIDYFLPELAQYVHTFNRGDSLSMSPHLSDEISKRANMIWQNLLKDLKAKDVSATSAEKVREFLATSGNVHFSFDPENKETWGKAVGDASVAMKAIDSLFA